MPRLLLPSGVLLREIKHFYNASFKQPGSELANVVVVVETFILGRLVGRSDDRCAIGDIPASETLRGKDC